MRRLLSGLEIRMRVIKGLIVFGGVAERLIAPVLKTGDVSKTSVGSNPTPTANAARVLRAENAASDGT